MSSDSKDIIAEWSKVNVDYLEYQPTPAQYISAGTIDASKIAANSITWGSLRGFIPYRFDPDHIVTTYFGKTYRDMIIAPRDVSHPEELPPLKAYDRRYLKKLGRKASEKLGYIPHHKRAAVIRAEVNSGTRNCNNLRFWAGLPMCEYKCNTNDDIYLGYDPMQLA